MWREKFKMALESLEYIKNISERQNNLRKYMRSV